MAAMVLLATGADFASAAQSTALVIQINPEAHLDVSAIPLSFTVAKPGEIVMSQPVTVTAWVRSLPGQQIQLMANVKSLNGPNGFAPLTALGWSGSMGRTTGGAVAASCTRGTVSEGSGNSLISNWNQSGIATCTLTFALTTDPTWAAGSYTSHADLQLFAR